MILVNKFITTLSYNTVMRTALLTKLSLTNAYACPVVRNGKIFIALENLENFDSSRVLAAVFILRLLCGNKPYVLRFRLFQTFHEKNYDVVVVADFCATQAHSFIEFISLNVLPFLSKADFSYHALQNIEGVAVNFTVADLSFIRVVETHSIFFKWHDKVNVRLFFVASDVLSVDMLLSGLKFK